MNSTRHVVHRAFPPHACRMSTLASCSIASTMRLSAGTSNVPYPSTVSLGIPHCMRAGSHPGRDALEPSGLVAQVVDQHGTGRRIVAVRREGDAGVHLIVPADRPAP